MTSQNRVAIVTGAAGGIGRKMTQRLAADGFAVVVCYANKPQEAQQMVSEIGKAGGTALALQANVCDAQSVDDLFRQTIASFGRVDVVVNGAGIMPLKPIADGDVETFDKSIATNLRGAFIVMSRGARHVAAGGRIIALSSSVIGLSLPTYGYYIAAKAGVEGLVRVLANELRGKGISVNAVAPGPIPTELFLKGKSEAQIEWFRKQPPLERLGKPEDVAGVVSFLCGSEGAWINGQVVRVNGGLI